MLKDITLGQYFPGNSVVHKLDPRTKLVLVVAYIVTLFIAKSYASYFLILALLVLSICLSGIKVKTLTSGIKPLIVIIILTAVLNVLFTAGEHVIVSFWKISISWEGIEKAVFMIARLIMLIMGTILLTYTTSPIALTDGLERLLSPLKALKLPVHELALMMSIALRFIPTLIEETDKIMSAQKARGADFETGSLVSRAKALLPILVPLFISAFRRADELATAMESRCYNGGEGRTRLKQLKMENRDYAAYLLFAVVMAGTIILARFGL